MQLYRFEKLVEYLNKKRLEIKNQHSIKKMWIMLDPTKHIKTTHISLHFLFVL